MRAGGCNRVEVRGKRSTAVARREGAGQKPAEDGWAEEELTSPCSRVTFLPVLVNGKQFASSGFGAILMMSSFSPNFPLPKSRDDVQTPAFRLNDVLHPMSCAGNSGNN